MIRLLIDSSSDFTKEERAIMDESAITATKAVELMIIDEIGEAMNLYNKKAKQVE